MYLQAFNLNGQYLKWELVFIVLGLVVYKNHVYRPVGEMGDGEEWWCLDIHGHTNILPKRQAKQEAILNRGVFRNLWHSVNILSMDQNQGSSLISNSRLKCVLKSSFIALPSRLLAGSAGLCSVSLPLCCHLPVCVSISTLYPGERKEVHNLWSSAASVM